MNDHQKRLKKLYMRMGASVLFFVIFLGMNINAVLIGPEGNSLGMASLIPLVAAYFALPRRIPRIVGADTSGDADLAMRLDRLVKLINGLRAVFLILAVFVLVFLRYLVPTPT